MKWNWINGKTAPLTEVFSVIYTMRQAGLA
jgi:hypothetical protein